MAFLTPSATGERDVIRTFIAQQFAQLRTSVYGLDDEQIHLQRSASALTPAMLLRHLTQVAQGWGAVVAAAPEAPTDGEAGAAETGGDYHVSPDTTLADLLADFDAAVAALDDIVTNADLDALAPAPAAPWYPPELTGWEVRWVLHHIMAETARHAGHADIIRESIDGKGSYELNARADGELADDEEFPTWG